METLGPDTLKKLERLTRIKIDEANAPIILKKLGNILHDFALLQNAPVTELEPLFYFSDAMPLREDVAQPSVDRAALLKNAPASTGEQYKIPSFLGESAP